MSDLVKLPRMRSKRAADRTKEIKKSLNIPENDTDGIEIHKNIVTAPPLAILPQEETKKKVIWKPFPGPQTDFLAADEDEVLFSGGRGPLVYGEKVLLDTGFTNIEDVKVGDIVICPDNSRSNIVAIPFNGKDDCYEIEFMDGRKIKCGQEHEWPFEVSNRTLKKGSKRQRITTTKDLYNRFVRYKTTKTAYRLLIPLISPVEQKNNIELAIKPYTLGVLLGDGSFRVYATQFTSYDEEIIQKVVNQGYKVTAYTNTAFGICGLGKEKKKLGLTGKLSNAKHIPREYLEASIEDRFELLRGLMDTDGYTGGTSCEYTTVSKELCDGIRELIWSLGGKASVSTKIGSYKKPDGTKVLCQKVYRINITFEDNTKIFSLSRKKNIAKTSFNGASSKLKLRIKNIIPIGKHKCKCITIDHPEHLFITTNYIVTKNSGKSDAFLVDPLRYVNNPDFRGLILRRTMPALKDLVRGAKELYFKAFPSCKWREQEKMFTFPSGASIDFGYLDNIDDCERYHGQEYSWLGIDEISQFPDISWYYKLKGSIRSTKMKTKIRCTSNPTGVGRNWVKEYWVDQGDANTTIVESVDSVFGKLEVTKKWLHSTVRDNPALMSSPQYLAVLATYPEPLRSAWLDGSWDAIEGMAFPEFSKKLHVIEPIHIHSSWVRFRGCDWGYASPAVCLWCAIDYDNNIYVYRELAVNGDISRQRGEEPLTAGPFARKVLELEQGEFVKWGVLDASTWAKKGDEGPSIAEAMEMERCFWRQSDRSAKQREAGKLELHRLLKIDSLTQKPKIFIFNTCKELIKELASLPIDETNPEDVDTDARDHAYDALRYALMSRPNMAIGWEDLFKANREMPIIIDPDFGA